MSTVEKKWKITTSIDSLSDQALEEILEHIDRLEQSEKSGKLKTDITTGLANRIERNIEVLRKLA